MWQTRPDMADTVKLRFITPHTWENFQKTLPLHQQHWLEHAGFQARAGQWALVPGEQGEVAYAICSVDDLQSHWEYARFPKALPRNTYQAEELDVALHGVLRLGWDLGSYTFDRYKACEAPGKLLTPSASPETRRKAEAIQHIRDLINTPAEDMGPEELAQEAKELAEKHRAQFTQIVGDDLLSQNFPAIHRVGRASARAPRLIDIRWRGSKSLGKVTLIGKGVCFDSGGLDIKSDSNMHLMKKDMGGGAHALGIAHMIMDADLPVTLRVLVPAVENSVSANAMRPLDIVRTRKGLTVEIGHTDAEGRLILCDALAEADSENPDMIINLATLTGAARVALGPSLPALFSNNDDLAHALLHHGQAHSDPLWRLPLWRPYRKYIETPTADLSNDSETRYGGAITAALFLEHFVNPKTPWAHIDLMGWNTSSAEGRPLGGEAMGALAVFEMIRSRFA